MKYKDYRFTSSDESIELTYMQAEKYFEETLDHIETSKFDLFNDEEELSLEFAKEKYNEINRRLQTFGQSFELFMKYIIHSSRLEKNPNLTIDELWNRWIRGHQMVPLINEKANSPEVLPNFKEIFNLSLNSYYGIYGWNFIRQLGFEGAQSYVEPIRLFLALQPQNYNGTYAMTDEDIEKIIEKNTAIYEKCRYNIEKMTNYNFGEVFQFISFIRFFAKMIHLNNNKTEIDYNVAYVHAMVSDPVIHELLKSLKDEKEIQAILNNEFINKDARLLAYILTNNKYSIEDINNIVKMNKQFENADNLFMFLTYDIPIKYVTMCNEKGYDVMLLASNFTFEQIEKIISIPVIGEYLNKNSVLVNKMITQNKSDVGLTFEDWYRVLCCDALKENPGALIKIVSRYMEVYHCISKNNMCNHIFSDNVENKNLNVDFPMSREFSKKYSDFIISNIEKNVDYFKVNGIDYTNIPVTLDHENVKKILFLLSDSGVTTFSPSIFALPYNEVYAVINNMKKTEYDFTSLNFQVDFWKKFDQNAPYDMLLKDNFLLDEFMLENGLIKISDQRYCRITTGTYISSRYDNPLPNLKK